MNRTGMAIAVGTLFCFSAAAQSQTDAQAGAQSSGQASAQAVGFPATTRSAHMVHFWTLGRSLLHSYFGTPKGQAAMQ